MLSTYLAVHTLVCRQHMRCIRSHIDWCKLASTQLQAMHAHKASLHRQSSE